MSRGIDLVVTATAVGIFGYFVYKVILPKLGDLQLPSFQPIQPPPPQQPAAPPPQGPAPAVTMPDKVPLPTSILPDPEKPKIEKQPATKSTKTTPQQPTATAQQPPASQPTAGGALLYDSNRDGKWNNGQKRTVTTAEGGQGANGKGFQTAASGTPTLTIDGNGVAHLTSSKFGRIYIYANNYNARLEGNLMFESTNDPGDDISLRLRSRHGHDPGIHPIGGSDCGGIGASYGADGTIKMKAEPKHDTPEPVMGGGKASPPVKGKWYKFAFSVWDGTDGSVNSRLEIDGRKVGEGIWKSPAAQCKDQALYAKDSYIWLRLNSTDKVTPIKAAFSNLRLTSLSAGSNLATTRKLMIDEPYLYNGFHNRRRQ